MKLGVPWSVKGIKPEARETAKEAARRSGMSLSDWLNSVIIHSAAEQAVDSDDGDDEVAYGGQDINEVQTRLDDLTRRIDRLTRRGPEAYAPLRQFAPAPAPYAPPLSYAPPAYAPPAYAPPPYAPAPPMAPAYAPPPAAPGWSGGLENAVAEIAARRRALSGEASPQPAAAPPAQRPLPVAMAPAAPIAPAAQPPMPSILRAPLPTQDLSGLEEQLRNITDRIDTLRSPGVEDAINALRGELAEIGHSLTEAMPRQAIDTIERQIQSLAHRVAEGRQAGVDGNALVGIEQGLAEVRDALYHLTPAESLNGFAETVHSLAQKIDMIVAEKDPATLQQLENAINTLRQISTHVASNEAVSRVASDVAMLSEKIDHLASASAGGDALSGLEQRISALSDALAVRSQSGASVPPKLEALVNSLSDKIEQLQLSRGDNVAFGHLEDRIVKLVEKLDASDSRLTHLEAIERGLGDLLVNISEMRAQKGEAGLRNGDIGGVDALKQDIARTQDEIQAVHGTLSQVVERLAMIEQGVRGAAKPVAETAPSIPLSRVAVRAVPSEPMPLPPAAAIEEPAPVPVFAAPPPPPPPPPPPAPEPPVMASPPLTPAEPPKRPLPKAKNLPINPDLPPDLPLEPGSGPPQFRADPAARIAASEAALGNAGPAAAPAPEGKSSFIAAARRAAQAALADKSTRPPLRAVAEEPLELTEESPPSLRGRLSKRIKSLFVAASVIAIVIGGLQLGSSYFQTSEVGQPGGRPVQTATKTPAASEPVTTESTDNIQTGSTPAAGSAAPNGTGTSSIPGMIPAVPPYGFSAPPNFNVPDLSAAGAPAAPAAANAPADVTGSISRTPRRRAPGAEPSPAAPQSVPSDEIPLTIGGPILRKAAASGDAAAAYEIAIRYAEGRGVTADLGTSARWFERAARAGLAPAQFRLGSLYEKGQGVKKDLDKARQSYLAAAHQGNAKAMHNLAVLYAEGIAGKPDFGNASEWFLKAAARGIGDSQYNLAVLYARGLGVEKNLGESYKWFALAAAQGDKEATRKRDEVAAKLDAPALAAAKQAVQDWKPEPQPPAANTVSAPTGGWDTATPSESRKTRPGPPIKLGER